MRGAPRASGTNLQALIDSVHGRDGIEIVAVASDRADARALERAREAGVPSGLRPGSVRRSRCARSRDRRWLEERGVSSSCSPAICGCSSRVPRAVPERVINVHPALLPASRARAVEQALDYGVKVFGVTVHFVDTGVDTGPIILQRAVELPDARTPRR